jgi:hypothetical protein
MYGVKGKNLIVKEGDPNAIGMANRSETLYEVYEKCVVDRIIFGGWALNIVKSNDGGIAEIYHTDFSRLRAGKEDMFGNVDTYFYSVDWRGTQINPQKWKPVELPAFNMVGFPRTPLAIRTIVVASEVLFGSKTVTVGAVTYPLPGSQILKLVILLASRTTLPCALIPIFKFITSYPANTPTNFG